MIFSADQYEPPAAFYFRLTYGLRGRASGEFLASPPPPPKRQLSRSNQDLESLWTDCFLTCCWKSIHSKSIVWNLNVHLSSTRCLRTYKLVFWPTLVWQRTDDTNVAPSFCCVYALFQINNPAKRRNQLWSRHVSKKTIENPFMSHEQLYLYNYMHCFK